jgi:ATP-dependent Lhr-like helicase
VYDAVEQLAGAPVPASALETLTLPGRVPGYQSGLLDELTAAGEIVWSGAGGLPGGDGWLVLAPAHTAPLLLPPPSEITMTPLHEAVLAVLDGGGGMFFRMIADRAAGLLPEAERHGFRDTAVAAAIWDLVWAGRLTNDTLAPLRTVLGTGRPVADAGRTAARPGGPGGPAMPGAPGALAANGLDRPNGLGGPDGLGRPGGGLGRPGGQNDPGWLPLPSRPGRTGRFGTRRPGAGRMGMASRTGPPTVTGRWSLLPQLDPDPTRRLHALARTLLERHGILTKGAVTAERAAGGFGALYPVLRALPPWLLRGGPGGRPVRAARRGGPDAGHGSGCGRPAPGPATAVPREPARMARGGRGALAWRGEGATRPDRDRAGGGRPRQSVRRGAALARPAR